MDYSLTSHHGTESLILIYNDGQTRTLPGTHVRFTAILDLLRGGNCDEARIDALANPGDTISTAIRALSNRVAYRHGEITFDGDLIDTALSRHLVRMLNTGDERYIGFVRFMERLAANPSASSRHSLFAWINNRDFTITPDGLLVGYKGVQGDGLNRSCHSGRAFVDGVEHVGHIPNPLASTVTMPRSQVATERDTACLTGLHVGTYDYARSFGQRLLTVLVDPANVVSVPTDCAAQKMRVCGYTVLAVTERCLDQTTYDPDDDWQDDDSDDVDW